MVDTGSIGGAKDIAPAALRQRGEEDFRFETVGHVDHNLRLLGALDHIYDPFGAFGAVLKHLETLSLIVFTLQN